MQCVYCGIGRLTEDMCPSHTEKGHPEDWSAQNRRACNFVHRGVVPPEDENFWMWQARQDREDGMLLRLFRTVGVA